ncbi:hypothetical protein NK718_09465 [Alsobacter sp. SYSU M60028]|uniref:Uncharacterized protein n=1 Tax=Alsobacter ponti TaxID=2962936 RepID=A0ABT1LCD8_9HYPH|nr:mitofilin family membrane protein [Alsobacter ponti]MCP8938741.1 hypothetical protein [Alsobacter ponti]
MAGDDDTIDTKRTDGDAGRPNRPGRKPPREPATLDLTARHVADAEPTPESDPAAADPAPDPLMPSAPERDATVAPGEPATADAAPPPVDSELPSAPPDVEPEPAPFGRSEPPPAVATQPPPRLGRAALAGFGGGVLAVLLTGVALFTAGPLADLSDRLASLETAVGERAPRRGLEAVEKRAAAIEAAQQQARADIDKLDARQPPPPVDLAPLTQRLAAVERGLREASPGPAPAQPAAPVAPPPPTASPETARLAVAMLARDELAQGRPYARELAALEGAGADAQLVAALKPFAASGAPTPARLAADFAPVRDALTRPPEAAAGSVLDRATAAVLRVVKVRPVGQAPGDEPPAIAARTEDALRKGDLPAAAEALQRLPERDRAAAQPFLDRLRARIAAGQAADAILTKAVDDVLAVMKASGGPAR